MIQRYSILENELQAFVDGQLDKEKHAFIAEYLNANPEEAQRVAAFRQQNDLMHDLFDDVLSEPVPEKLSKKPSSSVIKPGFQMAAAICLLVIGGFIGWIMHANIEQSIIVAENPIVRQAMNAHVVYTPEVKHPVEVDASQEAHLVKWLSKRLDTPIKSPDLTAMGYQLVGGRLLASDTGPAAMFMYENNTGERLTLLVRTKVANNSETAFRFHSRNDLRMFYWIDGSIGYAITGKINKSNLLDIAHSVYQQIHL